MNSEQQSAALKLASWLLNPDGGGYSVGPWERDLARMVIGIPPVECVAARKPRMKKTRIGMWSCEGFMGITSNEAYEKWEAVHARV